MHLSKDQEPLIRDALPAIIALAAPVRTMFPGSGSAGDPRPLLAAFRHFPELVLTAVREQLQSPVKHFRIDACHAIALILQDQPSFGLKVIDDLIQSLALPDDHYGEDGSAEGNVARRENPDRNEG